MNIVIIDDNEQYDFIKALKEFKHTPEHFYSADKAYDYILLNRYSIDLIFIDEELDKSTSKIYKSGTDLGRAILNQISHIPLVMLTGTAYNDQNIKDIIAVEGFSYIEDKGEFGRAREKHLKKIINLGGVINKWRLKETMVLQIIKKYLTSLPGPKYNLYFKELKKGGKKNWNAEPLLIKLEEKNYALDKLLNNPLSNTKIIVTKIEEIIKSSKRDYEFQGFWKKKAKGIQMQLEYYWKLPLKEYEVETQDIDKIAFDYMLNVLYIKNKMNDRTYYGNNFVLNNNNNKVCVTNGCDKISANGHDNRFHHFKYKLIGRRITYGYAKEIGFSNIDMFDKKHLAALLHKGNTNTEKTKKTVKPTTGNEIKNPSIYSSHLGLFSNLSNPDEFIMNEKTVMFEEEQWLRNYATAASDIRKFLDEFKLEIISKLPIYYIQDEFSDLTDFINYYSHLCGKCDPRAWDILKTRIKSYLEDNLKKPAIDIINRLLSNT